jgi:hypothetical protein
MYITLVFKPYLKSSFCFLKFLSLPTIIITLINLRKVFKRLTINNIINRFKKTKVFIILRVYLDNKLSTKFNLKSFNIVFYLYFYKKTKIKKKHL